MQDDRIIPAYAGSTSFPFNQRILAEDHPRIRGVHGMFFVSLNTPSGSSPHTRGPQHPEIRDANDNRIIPAYAGSTSSLVTLYKAREDHPRIRGVHFLSGFFCPYTGGSSPHTRGPPSYSHSSPFHLRIIPAYAGSTPACCQELCCSRDHPRIRGVHLNRLRRGLRYRGSSPHTRGPRDSGGGGKE